MRRISCARRTACRTSAVCTTHAPPPPGQHHFTADVVYFYVNNAEQRVLARADSVIE